MKAFNEVDWATFFAKKLSTAVNEIEQMGKDYILRVDGNDYKSALKAKHRLEPLQINHESESVGVPRTIRQGPVEFYEINVSYSFTGSSELFKMRPNPYNLKSHLISVDEKQKKVSFFVRAYSHNVEEFEKSKESIFKEAFANLDNANKNCQSLNSELDRVINTNFDILKSKFESENDFFKAIKVQVNPGSNLIFAAPTVVKIEIPSVTAESSKGISQVPSMDMSTYEDVLKVIDAAGKSMERKPSLYAGKDEEQIRDLFIFLLETRYKGTTATGETFNRRGKTDILLKYSEDGSNLFVAECKFWHGAKEMHDAIGQLFNTYLTWRDSKAALLLYVQNKDFSKVLETIREEAVKHELFVRENGNHGQSSFSYIFSLPQDNQKRVFFEIIAFHFDEKIHIDEI